VIAATQVRERPILFSGDMVRALLAGTKTQTRRVVKPQPVYYETLPPDLPLCEARHEKPGWWWHGPSWGIHSMRDEDALRENFNRRPWSPYGQPGDRLWVREAFAFVGLGYDFDSGYVDDWWDEKVPATDPREPRPFMGKPTRAMWHRATWEGDDDADKGFSWRPSIHMPRWASRLTLEITDVRVERVREISEEDAAAEGIGRKSDSRRQWFARLWDQLNARRGYGWNANPYVWVVSFRQVGR
jgi:hypothetical protein